MTSDAPLVIAIDGPAGAGKSTVARKLAETLGLDYVDSGASYRAAALKVRRAGLLEEGEGPIADLVGQTEIRLASRAQARQVLVDGEDVTGQIRSPEVTEAAARISRLKKVREHMVALQRALLSSPGLVMEGRDIGTQVFPDADLKIYLVATEFARAQRRLQDDLAKGHQTSLDRTFAKISHRDLLDSERRISPLIPAEDAVKIDSTELTVDEVVEKIVQLVGEKCPAKLPKS